MRTTAHEINTQVMDSHAASISRFMNWAAERIAKEVEDNERLEAEAGTRDFVPPRRRRRDKGLCSTPQTQTAIHPGGETQHNKKG
jgi:hypothetical protein